MIAVLDEFHFDFGRSVFKLGVGRITRRNGRALRQVVVHERLSLGAFVDVHPPELTKRTEEPINIARLRGLCKLGARPIQ